MRRGSYTQILVVTTSFRGLLRVFDQLIETIISLHILQSRGCLASNRG